MTPSPAFLNEMSTQMDVARQDLELARSQGDDGDVREALARLDELDDLLARATDASLRTIPSLL